jgi:hypothetical protein
MGDRGFVDKWGMEVRVESNGLAGAVLRRQGQCAAARYRVLMGVVAVLGMHIFTTMCVLSLLEKI